MLSIYSTKRKKPCKSYVSICLDCSVTLLSKISRGVLPRLKDDDIDDDDARSRL